MGAGPAYIVLADGQTAEGPYDNGTTGVQRIFGTQHLVQTFIHAGLEEESFVDAGASKKWAV